MSFFIAVFLRLTWQFRLSENRNFWTWSGKYPQRLFSSGNLSELKMRSSFISLILTGSTGAGGRAGAGAAMGDSPSDTGAAVSAAAVSAAAAADYVVSVRKASCCFVSHSCRLDVWDGLSHWAKQHGTHNPFGCASFFKNPG